MIDDFSIYFSGQKLYGDDFSPAEIEEWFSDEAEGYANLGSAKRESYRYSYHELNQYHGFKHLGNRVFAKCLGVGSAYGDEFAPIAHQIEHITILDPSDAFSNVTEINGVPCQYVKPDMSGSMSFDSNQFDLMTSFGTMHHIPNVSHVIRECYRCLNDGGIMLLREPISSMGDWRKPRYGLTKRERGIPLSLLDEMIANTGFKVKSRNFCMFPLTVRLGNIMGLATYNNGALTSIDALFSRLLAWNLVYHRTRFYEKLAPSSVYYVLMK